MTKKRKAFWTAVIVAMLAALIAVGFSACSCGGHTPPADTPPLKVEETPEAKLADFEKGESSKFKKSDGHTNEDVFNVLWSANNVNIVDNALELKITDKEIKEPNAEYYGGEYSSIQKFGYGDYSVKMKPSKQIGTASTFFTYTGPYFDEPHDEIDIEFLGKDTTKVQFNYFINGVGGHEYKYDLGFDAAEEYHEYGFRWSEKSIIWFIDGKAVYMVDESPSTPGFIYMNTWCGTSRAAGWMGTYPDKATEASKAYYKWVDCSAAGIGDLPDVPDEIPVDPAEGVEPVALTFTPGDPVYIIAAATDNKSMRVTYDGSVPAYQNVKADITSEAADKNVFVVKIKNNGTTTPTVRINLNDSSITPDYSTIKTAAVNTWASSNGTLVKTDTEWGGSYFNNIPAGEEIIAAVYFEGTANILEFMIDSTLNGDNPFTASGDLTFSDYKFARVNADEPDPGDPGDPGDELVPASLDWWSSGPYTITSAGTGAWTVAYTEAIGWSCIGTSINEDTAGYAKFSIKLTNNGSTDSIDARIDLEDADQTLLNNVGTGSDKYGETYTVAPGETKSVEIVYTGTVKSIKMFIDSCFGSGDPKSGNITLSGISLAK